MTPDSTVTLYATPFSMDNRHVVAVRDADDAAGAVQSLASAWKIYTDCFWQRDTDGYFFRANGNINDVKQYNYCIFINDGVRNFAFIRDYKYINDALTLVFLKIDPWLNYAGRFVFHPSPMRRMHPYADVPGNRYAERVEVGAWEVVAEDAHMADDDDDYCFCVTVGDPSDWSVAGFWQALAGLIQGSGNALADWWDDLAVTPCRTGVTVQPNTHLVSYQMLQQIYQWLLKTDHADMLVSAYHVPKSIRNPEFVQYNIPSMEVGAGGLRLDCSAYIARCFWRKLYESDQFGKVILTCCGNAREYRVSGFQRGIASIDFSYRSTMNPDGCVTLYPLGYYGSHSYNSISSQSWDRVELTGAGRSLVKMESSATAALAGAASIIAGLATGGAASAVGAVGAAAMANSQFRGATEISFSDSGTTSGSMTAILAADVPIASARYMAPVDADLRRINTYFGTYGYSWNGLVQPLTPLDSDLPYWHYFETDGAIIDGPDIPQDDLAEVRAMFDRGVFVYKTYITYRKTEFAYSNHY